MTFLLAVQQKLTGYFFALPAYLATLRWTRICGTKGELRWDGSARNAIEVHDFATGEKRLVYPDSIGKLSNFDKAKNFFINYGF